MGCQYNWVEIHINLQGGELFFFHLGRLTGEIWNLSVAATTGAWTSDCVSRTDIGDFRPDSILGLLIIFFLWKFCIVLRINSIHSIDCILEQDRRWNTEQPSATLDP